MHQTATAPAAHPLAQVPDDDQAVARRVLGGETAAFEVLMRRYNQRVFRATRAVLQEDADAQDAAQQAWILAYRFLGTWEGRATFQTWLLRIALREALRRKRDKNSALSPLAADAGWELAPPSPETLAARKHVGTVIEREIDALPETLRTAFVLRDVQELSGAEAANVLEISEEALRVRLHRARGLLRARLASHFHERVGEAFPFLGVRCDEMVARVLRLLCLSPAANPG